MPPFVFTGEDIMKKGLLVLVLLLFLSGCSNIPTSVKPVPTENPAKTVTVSCAGDCTLGTDVSFGGRTLPVEVEAQGGDYGWFFRNVLPIFEQDDLTIVNMEGSLTTRGTRQEKTYAFRGDPAYVNILTEGSVEAATLANNHSLDYGEVGLEDTKTALDDAGILWFENLETVVTTVNGVKVGLIGLYDLNGSGLRNISVAMEQVKSQGAELVIVQVHWGIEREGIPTDRQREVGYAAIDAGADLVIGHHPHVLQGVEEYKGKMIAYSLGNFCFGGNQNPTDKDTMIYQQTFYVDNGVVLSKQDYQIYPCSISSESGRNNYQPTPLIGEEGNRVKARIQTLTDQIGGPSLTFAKEEQENLAK